MQTKIIDAHSHIGLGYNNEYSNIEEYKMVREALGIEFSFLMPQPIFTNNKNQEELDRLNNNVFKIINESDIKNKLFFIPMVSPIYTKPYILETYIEIYQPIALKIHFKNDYSSPELITEEWISIIKKYNIPLIVHTDYSKSNNNEKDKLKNLNSALKWFQFFNRTGIKGYLTHGARLNQYVLENINMTDNIKIGLGPDLLLSSQPHTTEQMNYLKILHDYVDPTKLIYDVDYNWNRNKDTGLIDLGSVKRIEDMWDTKEQEQILRTNSIEFFGIQKRIK